MVSPQDLACRGLLLLVCLLPTPTRAAPPTTVPPVGLRDKTPEEFALVGARVVRPRGVLMSATIVIRRGKIVAVGPRVKVPRGARVYPLKGRTVYPGFIDAYSEVTLPATKSPAGYWNADVTPERRVARLVSVDAKRNEQYRKLGITARLLVPNNGVIRGQSALVGTGDRGVAQETIRGDVALHLRLTVPRGRGRDHYPRSPMGAVALARQAFYDAAWYRAAGQARRINRSLPTVAQNDALEELQHYPPGGERRVMLDAINELYLLRGEQFVREFALNAIYRGSGNEYRRLKAIQALNRPVIVPVNFPKPPNVGSAEAALNVTTEQMMHWAHAPENPGRLTRAGVRIALTSHGLSDVSKFLDNVRRAVRRGLPASAALRALTQAPAAILGVADRVGDIAVGHDAHLIVADGDLFTDNKAKVLSVWVGGKRYASADRPPPADARGSWRLEWGPEGSPRRARLVLSGEPTKLKGEWETIPAAADPANKDAAAKKGPAAKKDRKKKPAAPASLLRVSVRDARLSAVMDGKPLGMQGVVRFTLVLTGHGEGSGQLVRPDGVSLDLKARRLSPSVPKKQRDKNSSPKRDAASPDDKSASAKTKTNSKKQAADKQTRPVLRAARQFPVNYPLGAFGLRQPARAPRRVLLKGATVWTCGRAGVLKNASVLIGDGKVLAVGRDLLTPAGAVVIDCAGKHITPGIIDCHSHMATDGGVNEATQAITAEVRIGDFIDCDDITIYRQLAGGVTSSNILHGSANPIGGQNQVIKLRWGKTPEEMKFAQAPQGIKFALGENVKQSNWGDEYTTRYPQTRMGVEQLIRDAFQAGREYRAARKRWLGNRRGMPVRRDLELDAIVEILAGERWIHCHSYRQDEILALIRTLDSFQVRIGSFQHILEGYKVAPEMARHGATGSAFSDWWAYKFEVIDAIPYNGALMHRAGIIVSFNSDDRELGRRLNQEAAKAVKYGGVPPAEALKFVTLNPAKQLRIDRYVGSLETGKDADLVVWSGPPLSIFSRCEQTWIDGARYFDRAQDLRRRAAEQKVRARLVQAILRSGEAMLKPGETNPTEEELWPRDDIYCHHHDHGHGAHHQRRENRK